VTDVKIYANTPEVELLLNGNSMGKRNDGTNGVFVWKDVSLKPGENRVDARGNKDGKTVTDNCSWILK